MVYSICNTVTLFVSSCNGLSNQVDYHTHAWPCPCGSARSKTQDTTVPCLTQRAPCRVVTLCNHQLSPLAPNAGTTLPAFLLVHYAVKSHGPPDPVLPTPHESINRARLLCCECYTRRSSTQVAPLIANHIRLFSDQSPIADTP